MTETDKLIASLPAGLDRAILRILSYHHGRDRAIGRRQLVNQIKLHGFDVGERQARACISQLRKTGTLICSAPGEDGGYYIPKDAGEFEEFVRTEYEAKIMDMRETLTAMKKAAEKTWGRYSPEKQIRLNL